MLEHLADAIGAAAANVDVVDGEALLAERPPGVAGIGSGILAEDGDALIAHDEDDSARPTLREVGAAVSARPPNLNVW
jgi:hypothetical protein